jgi:hypothetical protein
LLRGSEPSLESMMKSVTIIPGTTQFGYGTTKVNREIEEEEPISENAVAGLPTTDFVASIEELISVAPQLTHVSLVVAWHGTDLRCGNCQIKPKVEVNEAEHEPYDWFSAGIDMATADEVTQISGSPAVGGAPADRSIYEAIVHLKSKGLRVTVYPFVMMDIASDNTLPDPYSNNAEGVGQSAYPWRGRITCSPAAGFTGTVDKTATATTQVNTFFGTVTPAHIGWDSVELRTTYSGPEGEWSFSRFILTMARIAHEAGADDFLIGSEMRGITQVRSNTGFPGVSRLISLAAQARTILGSDVRISYAADWSEYHSYRPNDETGDVLFNMDPLWSDANIDFIGVDNYLPLTDWRNTGNHLDKQAGYISEYEKNYMRDNIAGGEYYDWFYATDSNRNNQIRTAIVDTAHQEHWVFRQKDFWNWWAQGHRDRPAGVRSVSQTSWVPQSKPIVFTEIGCPAVNLGSNQPNVFIDEKSSESALPHFSNGIPDAYIQRVYLETWLKELQPATELNPMSTEYAGRMFDMETASVWTWDARPYPEFPVRSDIWMDAENWQRGHWITGRVHAGRSFDAGDVGPFAFTNAEETVIRDGIEYLPWAITHGDVVSSGSMDKSDLEVKIARGTTVDDLFVAYPPSQVMNLLIFKGHAETEGTIYNFPLEWAGRIRGAEYHSNTLILNCEPVSTSMRRPGLRRSYQVSCPHVLYGSQCRANKKNATFDRTVSSVLQQNITISVALPGEDVNYSGGLIEWDNASGGREVRTILNCNEDRTVLKVRGFLRGVQSGTNLKISFGCNRFTSDCRDLHNNILNYGGQPWIPFDNPFAFVSKFY